MHQSDPDALRHVLDQLDGVKRARSGYMARCPAHDDRNPSLSVKLGDGGKVLLKCHAGCEYAAIAAALDLKRPSTPAPPRQRRGDGFDRAAEGIEAYRRRLGKEAARWHYHDALGEPIGVVLRWNPPDEEKTYRPVFRIDGRWHLTYPSPRPLYALDRLAARQGETVYVVEGEKCAEVLDACGLLATTSAGGAKAGDKADWSPLAGREVVIVPDAGATGRDYGREVASRLGKLSPPARCVTIELPDRSEGESVDDLLADCDGDTDRVRGVVEELSRAARARTPERIEPDRRPSITLGELLDDPRCLEPPETIASGCVWFDAVQPFGAIERGAMMILAAPPGGFKSATLLRLARGFAETGHRVAWMAGEMSDRMRLRRLLAQSAGIGASAVSSHAPDHTAKVARARERLAEIGDRLRFYRAPIELAGIEEAANAAPVVVIDYLHLIRPPERTLQGPERLEAIMQGLEAIRQSSGSTILLAAAQGREGSDGARHIQNAVRGSSSIEYTVDSLYALGMSADALRQAKQAGQVFPLRFDCLKQREGEELPIEVHIDGRTGLVCDDRDGGRP
jgi:hypothetical protein